MRFLSGGLALALLLALTVVPAQAQTVVSDPGTLYNTTALTGYATLSSDMLGMTVTGYDAAGASYAGSWVNLGSNYGVSTSLFTLAHPSSGTSGDTYNTLWRLSSSGGLSRLVIDGVPGNTLFDRTFGGAFGTSGSAQGRDFAFSSSDSWSTTAYYRNALGIGGAAPVGDLYTMVDIEFGTTFTGTADFYMDADNASIPNDISAVPEPATLLLLLTGMVPVAGVAIRRRRRDEEV